MTSTFLLRAASRFRPSASPLVSLGGSTLPIFRAIAVDPPASQHPINAPQLVQTREKSKTKLRAHRKIKRAARERMTALGLERSKPHNYIPRDAPIVNAISREDRSRESADFDKASSEEMKSKINSQGVLLRFGFTGLEMSDRVRKLFELTNGNQKEIIQAQKQRGMELFQRRPGDTGSSAVQVIALTTRIQQMQTHMGKHKKDNSSKRGLDRMYVRRRKLLDYMERREFDDYRKVVKTLGLMR